MTTNLDEELQKMILQSIQEAVIVTDLNGVIMYWNKGAEILYGWMSDEVIGKIVTSLITTKMNQEEGLQIMSSLSKGNSWTGQFMVTRKDGTEFLALVTDRPMYKNGELFGIVGTSVNMHSEYVRHQIATSAIAHELRAPVTGIIGMLKSILKENPVNASIEDLEMLHLASNTLLNFVNNLIELPNNEIDKETSLPTSFQKFALRQELQSIIDTMNPLGREDNISVSLLVSRLMPRNINSILLKFQQAFFNVLSNAFKYTKPYSQIVCHVFDQSDLPKHIACPGAIPFSMKDEVNYLFVSVRDQGKGIAPEEVSQLFKSYSMLDNKSYSSNTGLSGGSTGLGLFNCKTFLSRLGGDVWLSWSEVDKGSEFTFALPFSNTVEEELRNDNVTTPSILLGREISNISTQPDLYHEYDTRSEQSHTRDGSIDTEIATRSLNVLVCDDDVVGRRIMTRLLHGEQLTVLAVSNGQQALDVIIDRNKSGDPIHILFMDLNMPVMDGYYCAAAIREQLPEGPLPMICAITANTIEEVSRKCKECGINQVFTKPMTDNSLKKIISSFRSEYL